MAESLLLLALGDRFSKEVQSIEIHADPDDPIGDKEAKRMGRRWVEAVQKMQELNDVWGWADVTVTVTLKDGRVGEAHMGGCSYLGPKDFMDNCSHFEGMVSDAIENAVFQDSAVV